MRIKITQDGVEIVVEGTDSTERVIEIAHALRQALQTSSKEESRNIEAPKSATVDVSEISRKRIKLWEKIQNYGRRERLSTCDLIFYGRYVYFDGCGWKPTSIVSYPMKREELEALVKDVENVDENDLVEAIRYWLSKRRASLSRLASNEKIVRCLAEYVQRRRKK